MPKDALTTVRLNEVDAEFAKQQVAIANALAAESYRREYTLADLFRMTFVEAVKAYRDAVNGMSRETVPPFVEWIQTEFRRELSSTRRNRENQQNRQNHKFPLMKAAGQQQCQTGRPVNSIAGRGPLRILPERDSQAC